jgi:hypothetical protein
MALPGAWPPPGNPKIAEGKIEKNRKPMQAKFLPAPGASPPASILDPLITNLIQVRTTVPSVSYPRRLDVPENVAPTLLL